MLDGVYRTTAGVPVFHAVRAPTAGDLQVLLTRIIKRLMKFLTRKGSLIEEQGMAYLADPGPETALAPLQQAAPRTPREGQLAAMVEVVQGLYKAIGSLTME